jgi:hypothetical protein
MTIADAGAELERALGVHLAHLGGAVTIDALTSRPWASVTFSGARHRIALTLHGPGAAAAADAFLAGLGEREFPLPGHVLVDIAAVGDMREGGEDCVCLKLEGLTVEAC